MANEQLKDVVKHVREKTEEAHNMASRNEARLDGVIMWLKGLFAAKVVIIAMFTYIVQQRDDSLRNLQEVVMVNTKLLERHTAILEAHGQAIITSTEQAKQQMGMLIELIRNGGVTPQQHAQRCAGGQRC